MTTLTIATAKDNYKTLIGVILRNNTYGIETDNHTRLDGGAEVSPSFGHAGADGA